METWNSIPGILNIPEIKLGAEGYPCEQTPEGNG